MNKIVLVIEDDEIIREFVTMLLQERDFRVVAANNGRDGVRLAHVQHPDVIMSDLHMSGGDGLFVLRSIREDPETAKTPFLLVTADLSPEARERCYQMGADEVFLKPFDPERLVRTLCALAGATSAAEGGGGGSRRRPSLPRSSNRAA